MFYLRTNVRLLSVLMCSICIYGYFFVSSGEARSEERELGNFGEISATTTQSLSSLNNMNTLTRQLEFGMSGSDVRNLQRFYSTDMTIYPEGLITGYYGPRTREATKRYQNKNGLAPTGSVGPLTLLLLKGVPSEQNNGSAKYISSMSYHQYLIGITDSLNAPIMDTPVVRTSSHSTTFTWMTDIPAIARVYYSTTWPFIITDVPSFTATGGLSTYQSVTVSGLPSNTNFAYILESTGASGQKSVSTQKLFTTNK